jgi:2-keto-3-deoxy-L-fuconate dehydrogenase
MAGRLQGKRAFITAAGQGIGRATALAFAAEGADVLATDLDAGLLEALKKEAPSIAVSRLDVLDTGAVQAAAAGAIAGGPVDVLFNCAGFVHAGTILQCSEKDWDFSFDLNVKSMWRTLNAFLPHMVERRAGSIINMASVASSIKGVPNRAVYCASKAAVIGLTRGVAADTAELGIRVNAICPGTVDSPSLEERIKALPGGYEANRAAFVARQKMGRLANASEIAALAVYLASDESAFVTGIPHVIDGGFSL